MAKSITLKKKAMLAVYGPAKILVKSGLLLASGAFLEKGELIVPFARGVSLIGLEDSIVEISAGANASIEVVEPNNIIMQWLDLLDDLRSREPKRILILGQPDSGKSTFSLWIYNRLSYCLLETDIGQNELGEPTMISIAKRSRSPSYILQDLKPSASWFVGHVKIDEVIPLHYSSIARSLKFGCDKLVIDTDGFLIGLGFYHKLGLVELVEPEAIVELSRNKCFFASLKSLRGLDYFCIKSPFSLIRSRRPIDRRGYRNLMYAKLFKKSKPITLNLEKIVNLCPLRKDDSGCSYLECSSTSFANKRCHVKFKGTRKLPRNWARGLVAGINTGAKDIISIVERIDLDNERIVLRIPDAYANSQELFNVVSVKLGFVRLDDEFREISKYPPKIFPEALMKPIH